MSPAEFKANPGQASQELAGLIQQWVGPRNKAPGPVWWPRVSAAGSGAGSGSAEEVPPFTPILLLLLAVWASAGFRTHSGFLWIYYSPALSPRPLVWTPESSSGLNKPPPPRTGASLEPRGLRRYS